MVIKKDGTRKIIALLAIMALLVSSSIALAQEIDGGDGLGQDEQVQGEQLDPGEGEPGDGEEPGEEEEPDEGEEPGGDEELGGDEEPGEDEEPSGDEELGEGGPDEGRNNDPKVDKSKLELVIKQASGLEKEDYTQDSWEVFASVLAAAEAVMADDEATQEEVDNALDDLEEAIDALEEEQEEEEIINSNTTSAPADVEMLGGSKVFDVELYVDFKISADKEVATVGEDIEYTYTAIYKGVKYKILGVPFTYKGPILIDYSVSDNFGKVVSQKGVTWKYNEEKALATRTKTVTSEDIDPLVNKATLKVDGAFLEILIPEHFFDDEVTVDIIHPSIEVTKSADKETVYVGDEVIYTYTITNTGDVQLYDITLRDDKISYITLAGNSLDPGRSVTATGTYTATEEDGNNGSVTNTATVTARYGEGDGDVVTAEDEETVTVKKKLTPSIKVEKYPNRLAAKVNEEIVYSYKVTNTGNVLLTNVTLIDDKIIDTIELSIAERGWDGTLKPGEVARGTATYKVTEADGEAGYVTNTATAEGTYLIDDVKDKITETVTLTVQVTEEPKGNVRIEKRKVPWDWDYEMPELMGLSDSPGEPHADVTFRLKQVEGNLTFEGETGNNGILEFNGIPVGDYMLEEEVPEGYEFDYWCGDINEDNVISVNDNTTAVIFVLNRELPKGTIKVVKTLNERNGEPQKDVPFELKRYRFDEEEQILASYTEEDGWPWIEYTDEEGEILFDGLECEGYYYTLREIGMEDYDVEYQDLYGDLVDVEKIQTWPGEGPTIYVINTPKGGEEPGGDDEPPSGGGGSRRRRPRTVEEEPVEVPEEPEVLTPPVAEEPVEEPVVVEEPMVTAPVLPALPHTGGNPAAFVIAGAALAGLGLYVRKRR